MDIDAAGEVGGEPVFEPVVIGEPGILTGERDEITGAGMVEAGIAFGMGIEDLGDAWGGVEELLDGLEETRVADMDMGDLMICDGEHLGLAGIEEFASEFLLDGEPALLAEETVEVDGSGDGSDAVLAEDDDVDVALLEEREKIADEVIDATEVSGDVGVVGAEALEGVIEVGQVNELKGGLMMFLDPTGGVGDPAGGGVRRPLG